MPYRYLIFHKPYGVLSQFTADVPGQRTLDEFNFPKGFYAAGRLDRDSEGLLLLTNDGSLIKKLLEPGKHERTYLVQVEGIPSIASIKQLEGGVLVKGYRTLPARVRVLEHEPAIPLRDPPIRFRKSIPTIWIELTLREGKNRQVRHMTAAVGHPTLRLVRTAIGPLTLGDLRPGQWRELTSDEIALLKQLR
ncbi:MAG TPA: pseudouridine synthase [Candidatus Kapabacteria bacterium]|nr:pseudouridine synthase [Candidatus Kapabacteria bacterium]